jgi:competence protein ComEC
LFGPALGVWAASLTALWMSATAAVAMAGVAAAMCVAVTAVGRYRPRHGHRSTAWRWLAAGALLGVVCGGLATASRTAARDAEPLAGLARSRADTRVEMSVTDDPRSLRSTAAGPATTLVPARLTRVVSEASGTLSVDVRVIVFATDPAWRGLLPSQRVAAEARLGPARGGGLTAATVTARGAPEPLGSPSWAHRLAGRLRAGLQAACAPLPDEPGGLLPGLVIGDTSRLDPGLAEEFRATGLTHLVAVSGANVAIVLGAVLLAARWCRAPPWLAAAVCAVALVGFVILARPSPSVVRAAGMGAVGLLALASGGRRAAAPALAVAVIVGLLIDPALAVDAGFALSAIATGALVLLAPRWRDGLRARGVPRGVAEALAVPAAAQVACAPVVAALSGGVSLVAVPANLLAIPAVAPATVLGVGSAVLSPLWPVGAEFLAWLASWPAAWLVGLAHVGAAVPAGTVPWPGGPVGGLALAGLTVAGLLAARRPVLRRLVLVAAVGVAVGALPVRLVASGWPPDDAVIVACDVGQGDAVVLPTAPGRAVVVDAGPDPTAVDGCLRRLGVHTVVLLVITHFHADHIGGVAGVGSGREIRSVALPAYDEPADGERVVRAALDQASVTEVEAGWTFVDGSVELRLLGPSRPFHGTRSDANNNSLVVRATSRGVSMLLSGDAETEEQGALVADVDRSLLRADVLKVAHHGSSYQDVELLDLVDPVVALVSVGAGNRYGHPSGPVLARLVRGGARVLRTDTDGDVAVVVTGDGLAAVARGARDPP